MDELDLVVHQMVQVLKCILLNLIWMELQFKIFCKQLMILQVRLKGM